VKMEAEMGAMSHQPEKAWTGPSEPVADGTDSPAPPLWILSCITCENGFLLF
jgi:hypothetical protein